MTDKPSTFVRHRPAWFLVALLGLVLPLAWPVTIYVGVRLYETRGQLPKPDPADLAKLDATWNVQAPTRPKE